MSNDAGINKTIEDLCTISGISTHDEALKMITSLNQS